MVDEESYDQTVPEVWARCEAIARAKAQAYRIPVLAEDRWIVIAADTTTLDAHDRWYAKPTSYEDACRMLTALQGWITVYTVAVLVAYERTADGVRPLHESRVIRSESRIHLCMTQQDITTYLSLCPDALGASGALMIDGHGARYISSIEGSYTGIQGLPLYEVCREIEYLTTVITR
jgi:septum formation protein